MASVLNLAEINLPLGTFFGDGVRGGPAYPNTILTNAGVLQSGNFSDLGRGILYSPQNTWNIQPYASTPDNIVAATTANAQWLTLLGDNEATTIVANPVASTVGAANTNRYVQFDWPRVPVVTLTGANLAGLVNVTIFGTDWYGAPMQATYIVQNAGVYPDTLFSTGPLKAFYTITGVYFNGNSGATTVSVQTSNIFGLPYCVKDWSQVMNFGWDGGSLNTASEANIQLTAGQVTVNTRAVKSTEPIMLSYAAAGGTPGALASSLIIDGDGFVIDSGSGTDTSTVSYFLPNAGKVLFKGASVVDADESTDDVRGLFQLPEANDTWAAPPDGTKKAIFTFYSMGSDQMQNQLAAGLQPQETPTGTVPPLTVADLYGVPQYYTGVPA